TFFDNSVAIRVAITRSPWGAAAANPWGCFLRVLCKSPWERSRIVTPPTPLDGCGPVAGSVPSLLCLGPLGGRGAERGINAAKLLRACGGCLGARRRRRAWKTAISPGELSNER